ncbi:hypothetical protein HDU67_008228, partial [Dinochytrium kinnereticum]
SVITTVYSQLIQLIGLIFSFACGYLILLWHTDPRRASTTEGERRFTLVALHGRLFEKLDTAMFGLLTSPNRKLRYLSSKLLIFTVVTTIWKVGEIMVPSQVLTITLVESFPRSTLTTKEEDMLSSVNEQGFLDIPGWSKFYGQNAASQLDFSISQLASVGIMAVASPSKTFTVINKKPVIIDPQILSDEQNANVPIANFKDNAYSAFFVNNVTQTRMASTLASAGKETSSITFVTPALISTFRCSLDQLDYLSNNIHIHLTSEWTSQNYSRYMQSPSIYRYNGLGGMGVVRYGVGDGSLPTFINDRLNTLRLTAETTPANLLLDMQDSTFSSQTKADFAAFILNSTAARTSILRHSLYYACRGVIKTGRLTVTMSSPFINITKFEVTSNVNISNWGISRNVFGGYHAFRPVYEAWATSQTSCGNDGTACNNLTGLRSIGDTMSIATAVEGAYNLAHRVGWTKNLTSSSKALIMAENTGSVLRVASEQIRRSYVRTSFILISSYFGVMVFFILVAVVYYLSFLMTPYSEHSIRLRGTLAKVWSSRYWNASVSEMVRDNERFGYLSREQKDALMQTSPAMDREDESVKIYSTVYGSY